MRFCQSVLNFASNELQLNSDGSFDYKAVLQGDPTVPLHLIAYIFLRDALNQYLSVPENSLPLKEPPRGVYNWTPKAEAAAAKFSEGQ
jgi:hypothetical protein